MRAQSRPLAPTPRWVKVATPLGVMWARDRATATLLVRKLGGSILDEPPRKPWTSRRTR